MPSLLSVTNLYLVAFWPCDSFFAKLIFCCCRCLKRQSELTWAATEGSEVKCWNALKTELTGLQNSDAAEDTQIWFCPHCDAFLSSKKERLTHDVTAMQVTLLYQTYSSCCAMYYVFMSFRQFGLISVCVVVLLKHSKQTVWLSMHPLYTFNMDWLTVIRCLNMGHEVIFKDFTQANWNSLTLIVFSIICSICHYGCLQL